MSKSDAKAAIEQIKTKRYPEKYLAEKKPIYLIGVSFDEETRNVVDFLWIKFTGSEF